MTIPLRALATTVLLSLSFPTLADDASLSFGGDQYTAGQNAAITAPVARDAFMAGYDVKLRAPVEGDAHLAGFNVSVDADVTGDLYAAGYSVSITGAVGGDLTAGGNTISVATTTPVAGNLRLAAATVTLSSPTTGSALISAQTLTLDAAITGDLNFLGEKLVFGPKAVVTGKVLIHAPAPIEVPASVASADRVSYEKLESPDYMSEAGKTTENVVRGFWPSVWAAAIWWLTLVVVGAAFIAFMPRGVAAMEVVSGKRPLRLMGVGILGFSAVLGLIPVLAMTVVGLLLLPFAVIFAIVACSFAFLTGAYVLGVMLARRFTRVETNLHRLVVLAATLVVTALLGAIPLLGWLITLVILTFGFGVIATWLAGRSVDRAKPLQPAASDATLAATPGAAI